MDLQGSQPTDAQLRQPIPFVLGQVVVEEQTANESSVVRIPFRGKKKGYLITPDLFNRYGAGSQLQLRLLREGGLDDKNGGEKSEEGVLHTARSVEDQ